MDQVFAVSPWRPCTTSGKGPVVLPVTSWGSAGALPQHDAVASARELLTVGASVDCEVLVMGAGLAGQGHVATEVAPHKRTGAAKQTEHGTQAMAARAAGEPCAA